MAHRLATGLVILAAGVVWVHAGAARQIARPSGPTTAAERMAAWDAHQRLAAESPFATLPWRALGPAQQSARIEAIAVPPGSRNTIYVGPSAGNVWKTTNSGLTWQPIFEHQSAFAVGDISVAPSNADVVWVGTGEVQPRHSGYAFAGTGVFKSIDAGRTWTHMGLADSHHVGKILIDPGNTMLSTSPRWAINGRPTPSAASSRRPTAAGPGPARSSSTIGPARSMS
jgi:hypothetical protein